MSPNPEHDEDLDIYDMRTLSADGRGNVAKSDYIRQLNQTRSIVGMMADPTGRRIIPEGVPAKWAVVQVLSTKVELTIADIRQLLAEFGYKRFEGTIRTSLLRIEKFGFAVRHLLYKKRKRITGWQLTERGRQLPATPPQKKRSLMGTLWNVEDALAKKTGWTYIGELADETNIDKKKVGGALRKLYAKGAAIRILSSDTRKLWAHQNNAPFVSSWKIPTLPPLPPPKKKTPSTSVRAVKNNPTGKQDTMCLPTKPTLIAAVTDLVKAMIAKQRTFSAHDVTKALRENVNDLAEARLKDHTITSSFDINIAETGTDYNKGVLVAKIKHDDVRAVVGHLFNTGEMGDYSRFYNGEFFEYSPPAKVTSVLDPAAGDDSSSYDGSSTI